MKILAIGDFHGNLPKKIANLVKKEKISLILSTGDFIPFHYRELWFKHCFGKNKELWEIIGKNKVKLSTLKDIQKGEIVLKKLNNLNTPILTVTGNLDFTKWKDAYRYKIRRERWKWIEQDFFTKKISKYKNIKCFDYNAVKFNVFTFIGMPHSTFPGHVKSNEYMKQRKTLEKIFKKNKKENIIFISHNVPYNTKLDLISSREAHQKVKYKHYGSKLVRRIIEKYQPILHIGGHIHESRGKDKIKRTICVNPGAVHEGHAAIIDINKKLKVKLI